MSQTVTPRADFQDDPDGPTERLTPRAATPRDPAAEPRRPPKIVEGEPPWWRRFGTYVLLLLMAGADAYGFWNTLSLIIKRDTYLVLVFVIALSLGAILVSHQAGRLCRARREGYGASLSWIVMLGSLWLSLGLIIGWIRAFPPAIAPKATGKLAPIAAATDPDARRLAALLLVLYLLTGVLAMTHGYQNGDPRSAAVRQALRRREEMAMQLAERRYEAELAQGLVTLRAEDLRREEAARRREHEIDQARAVHLQSAARQFTARHVGDPAGTDELHQAAAREESRPPLWPSEPPEI